MSRASPTRYGDSVAFLLSQAGARTAQLFEARLAPLGVSPRAFGVMSNLAADDGRIQQELADALGIHRNNMVGLIDEMEAAGWVERHRSTEDRRAFHVRLTPAGWALVDQVNDIVPELDDTLTADLAPREQRDLKRLLQQVVTTFGLHAAVHPHLARRQRSDSQGRDPRRNPR
jgi:DNA-binding MarR family transcriptional regulator